MRLRRTHAAAVRRTIAVVALGGLAGCGGSGDGGVPPGPTGAAPSTFARFQQTILTPQCAGCHTAGSSAALQSGIVLDAAVAYENLFGYYY